MAMFVYGEEMRKVKAVVRGDAYKRLCRDVSRNKKNMKSSFGLKMRRSN